MRIKQHPILDFQVQQKKQLFFYFNGKKVFGYEGDTVAVALYDLGIKQLGESLFKHRPRGFYCAIGNCSSCMMKINGIENVKSCITPLESDMQVEFNPGRDCHD